MLERVTDRRTRAYTLTAGLREKVGKVWISVTLNKRQNAGFLEAARLFIVVDLEKTSVELLQVLWVTKNRINIEYKLVMITAQAIFILCSFQ